MKTTTSTSPDATEFSPVYFNRELSWLAFNRRVLELAQDDSQPLMERIFFLAIVSSNLDEFFEIRVSGVMLQVEGGFMKPGFDGLTPQEELDAILEEAHRLVDEQYACWNRALLPSLGENGMHFKLEPELTRGEKAWCFDYFQDEVYPVLTPLGIDTAHPFPELNNKALYTLMQLADPNGQEKVAIVPIPRILPRIVELPTKDKKQRSFIALSNIVRMFAGELFPGFTVKGTWAFRITRNSDLYLHEEDAVNLLEMIEEELQNRKKGNAVRLEISAGVPDHVLDILLENSNLPRRNVFFIDGLINLLRLMDFNSMVEYPDLRFPAFKGLLHPELSAPDRIFERIGERDYLLHHPYESFNPVVELITQAARDPRVFAIKHTLYRTSGDSPIIAALKEASERGKQVTVLVELKARFDEENNINWARQLEDHGVHVVYGIVGLKTHCKCLLVVRREEHGLRRYAHLGTGNYNPKTAKVYTDLGLFTAREELTTEVANLFNTLTGFAIKPEFDKLLVAPFSLHRRIQELIEREMENAKAGKPASIRAKLNSLIDQQTIDNLYRASRAGVKIELNIRGICGLVPGVPGLSENIRVVSIVGRFLEHSRIFCFENSAGGGPDVYLGSADWMQRNFFRRIECVFPILDRELRNRLVKDILPAFFKDTVAAKELQSDGSWKPLAPKGKSEPFSAQLFFMQQAIEANQR